MTEQEVKSKRAKSSRRRGKRGEYMLRDWLRQRGWKADRVPSSGAAQGFKGDVVAEKDARKVVFECKNYSGTFSKIYDLYDAHRKHAQDDVLAVAIPYAEHLCISMSTSLDALYDGADFYSIITKHPLYDQYKRTFDKLKNMEKLVGEADVLVLKDDRKPFIFVRYR